MGSPVRWVGTEGDMGRDFREVWSTYCCGLHAAPDAPCVVAHSAPCAINTGPYGGAGCAPSVAGVAGGCNQWYPAGLDYTLQAGDVWFWYVAVCLGGPWHRSACIVASCLFVLTSSLLEQICSHIIAARTHGGTATRGSGCARRAERPGGVGAWRGF